MTKTIKLIFFLIFLLGQNSYAKYKIKPSESMQAGISKERIYKNNFSKQQNEEPHQDENEVEKTTPYQGYFKIGNPYEIFGTTYFPQKYEQFEEVGIASWYGDEFHGKQTANGEIYQMGDLTAAHRTLPLPSIVRITNLNNNKTVIVRVNDRGPFAKNRVIDVSQKVAEILDFKNHGIADVKIELMPKETDEMLAKLKLKN